MRLEKRCLASAKVIVPKTIPQGLKPLCCALLNVAAKAAPPKPALLSVPSKTVGPPPWTVRQDGACHHLWFLRELAQEADVVLEKDLNIVDAILEHGHAVDADAESEAADFFGVVIHEAVDGGVDNASAEEFDPGCAFTLRAGSAAVCGAGSSAEGAGDVEFDAGLGEREIAGPEACLYARAKKLLYKIIDGAGEIAEGDVGVDGQAFDLVKDEGVRGVGIVAAIDLAWDDHTHGRLLLLHGANLHGRSVGAKKELRWRALRQF